MTSGMVEQSTKNWENSGWAGEQNLRIMFLALVIKASAVLEGKYHQLSSGGCKGRAESQDVRQVFRATAAKTCGSFAKFTS